MPSHYYGFSKKFLSDLNASNRTRDDPNLNQFRLMDDGKPIINSRLTEYPGERNPTRSFQTKTLDDTLRDFSDMNPKAVDLDKSEDNLAFLQNSIKNLVMRDTQLGEANINVSQGAVPQLNKGFIGQPSNST